MKKHNFSAGPSILPQEVFQKASEAILDFQGMGLSLLEISHRSKEFVAVIVTVLLPVFTVAEKLMVFVFIAKVKGTTTPFTFTLI